MENQNCKKKKLNDEHVGEKSVQVEENPHEVSGTKQCEESSDYIFNTDVIAAAGENLRISEIHTGETVRFTRKRSRSGCFYDGHQATHIQNCEILVSEHEKEQKETEEETNSSALQDEVALNSRDFERANCNEISTDKELPIRNLTNVSLKPYFIYCCVCDRFVVL